MHTLPDYDVELTLGENGRLAVTMSPRAEIKARRAARREAAARLDKRPVDVPPNVETSARKGE